jgi:Ca2+-binding EF-hand superfamily protein
VWEIDDDHDGKISWDEFRTAMDRCLNDQHAREPQQVFNVVLFSVFSGGSSVLSLRTDL